ncbi:hypothetical protein LF1_43960 [Rubripirellula obstinata]|uniref:Uncharacterized protein n=1 Tax=Rubripirellula obstinata TaxID=406547 RepID=A0A5B1CMQ0_9BACT|nr:hypothetical protein LF1_43960 [Rubripirellula obstinata]
MNACPGFETFADTMPRIGGYRLGNMVQATKTEKLSAKRAHLSLMTLSRIKMTTPVRRWGSF